MRAMFTLQQDAGLIGRLELDDRSIFLDNKLIVTGHHYADLVSKLWAWHDGFIAGLNSWTKVSQEAYYEPLD